jgi:Uma2 family endonuclease
MSITLRTPRMSREEFFDWAQSQDIRYEFDGFQPVAMTGGTVNHSRITQNIHAALRACLRGGPCEPLGTDAGVATTGDAVRYPDALVTCTKTPGSAHLVAGVVTVFEVLSPTSGRTDRIEKVREYRAVETIRRYVILEHTSAGLTVFERAGGNDAWTATTLIEGDVLRLPEIGIEIPVAEFYENVDLPAPGDQDSGPAGGARSRE